jgi:RimJ/RimL family protein N-acetyltransferase
MFSFRKPTISDLEIYFIWANDPDVRKQSFDSSLIDFNSHNTWFKSAIENDAYFLLIFKNFEGNNIGQVRIKKESNFEAVIGISVDVNQRGQGYASKMLKLTTDLFLMSNKDFIINAYIKEENSISKKSFEKADFQFLALIEYKNFKTIHLIKRKYED